MLYYKLFSDKEMYTATTMVDQETLITVEPHLTDTTEQETNTGELHTTTSESINDSTEHQETSTDILHTTQSESNEFTRLTTRSNEVTADHYKETSTANIIRQQSVARNTRNPANVSSEMPSENITTTVLYETIVTTQSKVTSKATSDVFPEENLAARVEISTLFVTFCIVLSCCHIKVG